MTGRLDYMGERTDLAAVHKLLGNAMIIGITAVMADILTLAKACGVDAGDAVGLLGALDMNAIVARRGKSMATGDFTPSFELVMARKDVRLMLEASDGLPMAVLPAVAARMDELIAAGHGARDSGVLAIDAVRPSLKPCAACHGNSSAAPIVSTSVHRSRFCREDPLRRTHVSARQGSGRLAGRSRSIRISVSTFRTTRSSPTSRATAPGWILRR